MKSSHEVGSIEELCELLRRSRLLVSEEIETLARRFSSGSREPNDLGEFSHWLVSARIVTEYQMSRLLRGRDTNYFLGGYKLLDQLSRGKDTVVYKGVDHVGRLAALKVLPAARAGRAGDPRVLARFLREGQHGGELNHDNVVRIVSNGEERGAHYLVMDFLAGETVQQVLAAHSKLPAVEVVEIGLQALAGLAYLHERGLIHRNIEPANLMLVQREGGGLPLVKIIDLGLSRSIGEADDLALDEVLGKAVCPAPEVVRDPSAADGRADLYSLGCVLYHALAGQAPFRDWGLHRQAPKPLRELAGEVPEELARVVASLLAREPSQRFASATEATEALGAVLAPPRKDVEPVNVEPINVERVLVEPLGWLADHPHTAPPPPPVPRVPPVPPAPPAPEEPFPSVFAPAPAPVSEPVIAAGGLRRTGERARLDRRDWLMLLAGAGGLLVVQVLAWLAARLLGAIRRSSSKDDQE
jgi:serine/threonine-protein kinase